jgi:poly(hydroxyalkanoate) depolymerase family esterase
MNPNFQDLMREATRLTRSGQLSEATAAIGRALMASPPPAGANADDVIEGAVFEVRDERATREASPAATAPEAVSRGSHQHASLTRDYRLYVPPGPAQARPLVVMLHGCTQDPDDFARGTGMDRAARERGAVVLYPGQASDANPSRCWNWFKHNHQVRGRGEAALIASLTQQVIADHGIDPGRVYIAGLSAGGAMAASVAAAYPEVFAAVGVHSGLAPAAAGTLPAAMSAMRSGADGAAATALPVPAIVFHGDQDSTVHPVNGQQLIAAVKAGHPSQAGAAAVVEQGRSAGGQRYTRTTHGAGGRAPWAEHWLLHGAGHAWAGGQSAGSYTDPRGPDATREMLRFFFSHAR